MTVFEPKPDLLMVVSPAELVFGNEFLEVLGPYEKKGWRELRVRCVRQAEGFQCTGVLACILRQSLPDPKNPCQRYKPVVALPQITFVEEVKNAVDETPAFSAAEAVNNPEV